MLCICQVVINHDMTYLENILVSNEQIKFPHIVQWVGVWRRGGGLKFIVINESGQCNLMASMKNITL